MSDLQQRLRELNLRRQQSELLEKVQAAGIAEEAIFDQALSDRISPGAVWSVFARRDTQPFSVIRGDSPPGDVQRWLVETVAGIGIIDECCLSLDGFGSLPWLRVKLKGGPADLVRRWDSLAVQGVIVLNEAHHQALGILEEEDEYQAHLARV